MTDVLEAKLCMKSEWKVSGKTIEWQKKDSGLDLQVSKIKHRAKTALIYQPDGRKGMNKFLWRT